MFENPGQRYWHVVFLVIAALAGYLGRVFIRRKGFNYEAVFWTSAFVVAAFMSLLVAIDVYDPSVNSQTSFFFGHVMLAFLLYIVNIWFGRILAVIQLS